LPRPLADEIFWFKRQFSRIIRSISQLPVVLVSALRSSALSKRTCISEEIRRELPITMTGWAERVEFELPVPALGLNDEHLVKLFWVID
jgi:hypothetical protein